MFPVNPPIEDSARTCCMKCGEKLPVPFEPGEPGKQRWCQQCQVFLKVTPFSLAEGEDLIDPGKMTLDKHRDEPIPFIPKRVEYWPELYFKPKKRVLTFEEIRGQYGTKHRFGP